MDKKGFAEKVAMPVSFSSQERGWLPVTLGKSRLRTETAALVAVTQVYSAF